MERCLFEYVTFFFYQICFSTIVTNDKNNEFFFKNQLAFLLFLIEFEFNSIQFNSIQLSMNPMEFELHLVDLESNSMYFNSMQLNLKKINSI